ncbi:HlyD family efflux transporter periplasmic adaptor subunit [Siccirubricoccus deserti]
MQLAKLGGDANAPVEHHPDYLDAAARVAEAERQLDHTTLRAPFAGVVTQVSSVQPGQYLAAATPAFALVSSDHVWVDALPKETDLTHVKPGDPATITIDTYPGVIWQGSVESISPASGSTFSVLPAQNASGVKVVQRIPVRIRVEQPADAPRLRAGMSAVVSIDTGHERHLSDIF